MSPVNPSDPEEEYFARQEMERRKREQAERAARMADEEREQLKALHWMKCPKCGMDMANFEFRGITLDRCGSCGGVYFDAGELEELLGQKGDFFDRFKKLF